MAGSPLPFSLAFSPPEKAVVVQALWQAILPTRLIWTLSPDPIDDSLPGMPRPVLFALTTTGWQFPLITSGFTAGTVSCIYQSPLAPGTAVRVLSQPETFHWDDRILRIPFRGITKVAV